MIKKVFIRIMTDEGVSSTLAKLLWDERPADLLVEELDPNIIRKVAKRLASGRVAP